MVGGGDGGGGAGPVGWWVVGCGGWGQWGGGVVVGGGPGPCTRKIIASPETPQPQFFSLLRVLKLKTPPAYNRIEPP